MKKNLYFGSAVAMLAMLASCAQDELGLVAEKPVSNDLAGRKNVGVVTFVTNSETRFIYEDEHAEAGDVLGVYLMDRYNHLGTQDEVWYPNANMTDPYTNSEWWNMYSMTNYISTNFSYTYDGQGNWENKQAELIEGNYVATYPRCEEATNRRDLWHQFEAVRTLNKKTDAPWVIEGRENVYVNFDNTFYVGYKRVYRDDEDQHAGANLKEDIMLHNVTTDAHFVIADYDGGTNYRIKKISIRRKDGQQVPTLVYVRPENYDKATAPELGIYNNKFTQKTARAITKFTTIPDANDAYNYVPYQYDEREPEYEYAFFLPEADGFEMNASSAETEGRATSDRLDVYMRIPCDDLSNYIIEVYADQWVKEGVTRHWEEGVFARGMISGTDNGDWQLDHVLPKLSEEGKTIPMGYLRFDNSCWTPYKDYGYVMNQDHLWEKLNSAKDRKDAITAESLTMTVALRGESITLDDDVMKFLRRENIKLRFVNKVSDNQKINLTAEWLSNEVNCGDYEVIVPEGITSNAAGENIVASITNYGTFNTLPGTTLVAVNNQNIFNFKGEVGYVSNEGVINAEGALVDYLDNYATINANGLTVRVAGVNYGVINANGNVTATTTMSNNGVINANKGLTSIKDNELTGKIYVTDKNAKVSVYDNLGYIETKGQVTIRGYKNNVVKITEKIDNVTASLIWVNGTSAIWNGGKVYNNPCANITNQPKYPYSRLVYVAENTLKPADVAAYNANNMYEGGKFNVLEVTTNKTNDTLADWVQEAYITVNNADASGVFELGSEANYIELNGNITILAGKTWTVNAVLDPWSSSYALNDFIDDLYIVVHDGGKLLGTAPVTSDINYNRDDEGGYEGH